MLKIYGRENVHFVLKLEKNSNRICIYTKCLSDKFSGEVEHMIRFVNLIATHDLKLQVKEFAAIQKYKEREDGKAPHPVETACYVSPLVALGEVSLVIHVPKT